MRAVEGGRRVTCVTATTGECGFPPDDTRSTSEPIAVREYELASCLSLLGVTEHRWLGYGDGQFARVPDEEAAATLGAIITEVRPDTVLTFGPEGGGTGHSDHIAACRWTTRAVQLAGLGDTRLMYATKTRRWHDEFFAGVQCRSLTKYVRFRWCRTAPRARRLPNGRRGAVLRTGRDDGGSSTMLARPPLPA